VLPAADAAAIVINPQDGIDLIERRMMEEARKQHMCRMIIVNKIDAEDVALEALLTDIQSTFGPRMSATEPAISRRRWRC
jgi:elongation factor G